MDKTKLIVICGSSKFIDVMAVCAWLLERDENAIVMSLHLLPWWYATKEEIPDHLAEHKGVAKEMDELHLRKIDLAAEREGSEIFLTNVNNYIGNSTRREIEYAINKGVWIRRYSDDPIGAKVQKIIKQRIKDTHSTISA